MCSDGASNNLQAFVSEMSSGALASPFPAYAYMYRQGRRLPSVQSGLFTACKRLRRGRSSAWGAGGGGAGPRWLGAVEWGGPRASFIILVSPRPCHRGIFIYMHVLCPDLWSRQDKKRSVYCIVYSVYWRPGLQPYSMYLVRSCVDISFQLIQAATLHSFLISIHQMIRNGHGHKARSWNLEFWLHLLPLEDAILH